MHIGSLVIVAAVMLQRSFDPWIRLTALAVLLQHLSSLSFAVLPRYHFAAWLFTYLVVVVWLRERGVLMFQRWFPEWSGQIRDSGFFQKCTLRLSRFQEVVLR